MILIYISFTCFTAVQNGLMEKIENFLFSTIVVGHENGVGCGFEHRRSCIDLWLRCNF